MPEQPPPKHRPPLVPTDAEQRARELAQSIGRAPANQPEPVAVEALEEIASLAARAWGSDAERDMALEVINRTALAALAKLRG